MPAGTMDRAALAALEEAYDVKHEKTYGHRAGSDEPVELVTLKVIGPSPARPSRPRPSCRKASSSHSHCAGPILARPTAGATPLS